MLEQVEDLLMKISSFFKQHWKAIIIKPIALVCIVALTCMMFNFLLIPTAVATTIGTFITELKDKNEDIDILFLGSSRSFRGIDTASLTEDLGVNVFNLSYESPTYFTTYYLLKEAYDICQPQEVYLEVSTQNFKRTTSKHELDVYQQLTKKNRTDYKENSDFEYTEFSLFEFSNFLNNFSNGMFAHNLECKFGDDENLARGVNTKKSTYKGMGYLESSVVADKKDLILPESYFQDGKLWGDDFANKKQLKYFYKIIEFCQSKNIKVTLYSPPYPEEIFSPNKDSFVAFDLFLNDIMNDYGVDFIDFSKIKKDIITLKIDMFYDANHCNSKGAKMIEPVLVEIINQKENGTYNYSDWFYDNYLDVVAAYSE